MNEQESIPYCSPVFEMGRGVSDPFPETSQRIEQIYEANRAESPSRCVTRGLGPRDAIAVGHSILVIYYHMMKTGEPYQERGVEYLKQMDKQRLQRHLVQRLESLCYQVTVQAPPAA